MTRKKQLLFINGHLRVGGVEKSLLDLLRHLDYTSYDVDLLLFEGKGEYFSQLPPHVRVLFWDSTHSYGPLCSTLFANLRHGRFSNIAFRLLLLLSHWLGKRCLRLFKPALGIKSNYDCAIAYRHGFCADALAYMIRSEKKICWWHHGVFNIPPSAWGETEKVWSHFDSIVAVSGYCRDFLAQAFPRLASRLEVIPNMVDEEEVAQLSQVAQPYCSEQRTILVTVCRLSAEKHIEDVVYATDRLRHKGIDNFVWHVVGDGPERERIERLIGELNLQQRVVLTGMKDNPYPYIRHADVYVNTSHIESQCLAVIEAMMLHTPCVVTQTGGTDEYTRHLHNSIVCPPGTEALAHAVEFMLQNKALWPRLCDEAYATVTERFGPDTIINQFENIIS